MNLNIRQATHSDLPYIYDICLRTGESGNDASPFLSDPYIVGQYFAAPYLHFEIDLCFVLENQGIPLGYTLGTLSTQSFNEWMNKTWLPRLRQYYPPDMKSKSSLEQFFIDIIHKNCDMPDYLAEYPSHLHIDLLPPAQKKGFGKKLIHTFISKLKEKGSAGVHLGVGMNNTNAIGFYLHLGFGELKVAGGSVWMGMGF